MTEVWKPVVGFEHSHEVSDLGAVRSVDRYVEVGNRWGGLTRRLFKGKLLKPCRFSNGYLGVCFTYRGKWHLLHRLVAAAFIENPHKLPEVNHKNGVRSDCRVANLEWVSSRDNKLHSYKELIRKPHAKITPVLLIRGQDQLRFDSEILAAKHLGVNPGSVHSARTRDHRCKGYSVVAQ